MDIEMQELLKRHGMSAADVEAVAEFEKTVKRPRRRARVVEESLDFGSWDE